MKNLSASTGASWRTLLRWTLSRLKREAFYAWQAMRGYRKHFEEIPIQNILIGEQAGTPLEKWVEKTGDYGRVSIPLPDSPYVRFLKDIVQNKQLLEQETFLEGHSYFKMAEVVLRQTGNYFGARTPAGITDQMQRFYQMYMAMCEGKAPGAADDFRHSQAGSPIVVNKILDSDCYEIKDGHHRAAAQYMMGRQYIRALVVGEKWTYLQRLLLSCLQVKGAELYQPIHRPEVRTWPLIRRCTDRWELILKFLKGGEGLGNRICSVLDLPCSYGWFVAQCKQAGFRATGVDRDPAALKVGRIVYGLTDEDLQEGEVFDYLDRRECPFDMVLCLSILHHFASGKERGDEKDFLRRLDRITGQVLILDSGQEHEAWFHHRLRGWNEGHLESLLRNNTTFRKVIKLGKDFDDRGRYEGQYGRTLFACIR